MKLDDDLKERFAAADPRLRVDLPPFERIAARGRARRVRRYAGSGVAVGVIVAALGVSLSAFLPIHPIRRGASFAADGGALRTSLTNFGVSVTYPSDWTLLIAPADLSGPGDIEGPVFQLSSFDPGALGSDAAQAWRCPLRDGALPADGALLVVRAIPSADADGRWPVTLGSAPEANGDCGEGDYARWRSELSGFEAFSAAGPKASAEDAARVEAAFASLGFATDPHRLAYGPYGRTTPDVVLASGQAFGAPWNLTAWTDLEHGAPRICLGVGDPSGSGGGCFVRDDGSLDVIDPLFGNQDFEWSSGQSCGAGHDGEHSLWGMVSEQVASVDLVLLDGRTILIELVDLPPSWDVPYRAWVGAVADPPTGETVGSGDGTEMRDAGRFVLRDAQGNELSQVPFGLIGSC